VRAALPNIIYVSVRYSGVCRGAPPVARVVSLCKNTTEVTPLGAGKGRPLLRRCALYPLPTPCASCNARQHWAQPPSATSSHAYFGEYRLIRPRSYLAGIDRGTHPCTSLLARMRNHLDSHDGGDNRSTSVLTVPARYTGIPQTQAPVACTRGEYVVACSPGTHALDAAVVALEDP